MRTIKFRGKSLHTGEWHYGDLVQPSDNAVFIQERGTAGFFSDPETVGQFTGLLDKNGKEIWEHDIVNWDGVMLVVKFIDGSFCMQENYEDATLHDLFFERNEISVIGNVFDNPELLEGGTE